MDTLINLILAAALQFTGAHVAQKDFKITQQEFKSTTQECYKVQAYFIMNNELICKETTTQ